MFPKKSEQEHLLPGPSPFLFLWLPEPIFPLFPSGFPSGFLPGSQAITTGDAPSPEVPHGTYSGAEKVACEKTLPGIPGTFWNPLLSLPGTFRDCNVFITTTPNFLKINH